MKYYYDKSTHTISSEVETEIEMTDDDINLWTSNVGDGLEIEKGVYPFNIVKSPINARREYEYAKSELESSDIEIKYHERNSKRAKLTVEQWYEYQEQLRDYATCNADGDYYILTDKPVNPAEALNEN